MDGVTADVLANLLKTNLNNLKSFAEQLNAELSEDPEGNESRESQRRDMLKVLKEFGEVETFFEKGRKCLQKVQQVVTDSYAFNGSPHVDEAFVTHEIRSLFRSLEGKEKMRDIPDDQNHDSEDDGFGAQQLNDIADILQDVGHPLKLDESEDEEYDTTEERRMEKEIEAAQRRLLESPDDEEFGETNTCPTLCVDDGDDRENIAPNSFERVEGVRSDNRSVASDKIDQLYNAYKNGLVRDAKVYPSQLYSRYIEEESDIEFRQLPLLPKFKEEILDLFSKDAIVVVEKKQSYTDPISKTAIQNPVRNKICEHIYERDTIYSLLKNKKSMACPCLGCSCRSFSANDLEENEEITARISLSQARARESIADDEDEVRPEDDVQSQEIL